METATLTDDQETDTVAGEIPMIAEMGPLLRCDALNWRVNENHRACGAANTSPPCTEMGSSIAWPVGSIDRLGDTPVADAGKQPWLTSRSQFQSRIGCRHT